MPERRPPGQVLQRYSVRAAADKCLVVSGSALVEGRCGDQCGAGNLEQVRQQQLGIYPRGPFPSATQVLSRLG
jgi:hypothetical protein